MLLSLFLAAQKPMIMQWPDQSWWGISESGWVAFGAIASGIAALCTLALAAFTAWLANETKELAAETRTLISDDATERAQSERHHQETLAPLIVVQADLLQSNSQHSYIALRGYFRNIGGGAAREAAVYIRPTLAVAAQFAVRPIAAGDRWDLDVAWTGMLESRSTGYPYELLVTFVRVFGTRGAIEYKSQSGTRDDLTVETVVSPSDQSETKVSALEQKYRGLQPVLARGSVGPR